MPAKVVVVSSPSLPPPQRVDTLADRIVRCGCCKLLFNRDGMVVEYKGAIWCAWCISSDHVDE